MHPRDKPGILILMEVELARHSGFCYGVKEALKLATEAAREEGPTYTYGPLIHNPQEIDRLRREYGVRAVETFDQLRGGTVVIRAHGVPPEDYQAAADRGLRVVDATCRFVVDVQRAAAEFARKGYDLFIVGEADHPEVRGIVGHVRAACPEAVLHVADSLEEILSHQPTRAAIVFQTTQAFSKFKRIDHYIKEHRLPWKIKNTICGATKSNQYAADELARRVDRMVVVGGKNSGNTHRLAAICRQYAPTLHIETAAELESAWFNGVEKVGVTAGASTPEWIVKEVVEAIRKL